MIIGLTGGIGSGKSTVCQLFRDLGICVVEADPIARDVVQNGSWAYQQITQHFGQKIILNNSLNRSMLREIVFNNPAERQWLEELLHPIVREAILTKLDKCESRYKILEAPLLFENGLDRYCRATVVVDLPPDLQLERTRNRDGGSKDTVKKIIQTQMSREEKLSRADFVISNEQGLTELRTHVIDLHNKLSSITDIDLSK